MCSALVGLHAQATVTTAGGDASGSGGSVSYTVGQVAYTMISSADNSVAQGVQQPYEISVITGIENAGSISLDVIAYPNPATDIIRLRIGGHGSAQLHYGLFDISGKLLLTGKVDGDETSIAIGQLVPAAYILNITERNGVVKSFSIIKT